MRMIQETPPPDRVEPDARGGEAQADEWVFGSEAQRLFGVSQWTWDKWMREGAITCGQPVGPSGRTKRYPVGELRRTIEVLRAPKAFPQPDMVDATEARRMFGVGTWTWDKWRGEGHLRLGEWFEVPGGGRTKLYPIEALRRIIEELQQFPPPGMLTAAQAAERFGVARLTWKQWVVQGKVRCGQTFPHPGGGTCHLYPAEEVEKLLAEVRAPDKAYWDPKNPGFYRIPPGLVRLREARRMFGVDRGTWQRWEREKQIACGERVHAGGPKLYPLAELQRLLEEYGSLAPPYPDPLRRGCYRVPLSGHDIRRKEAIIDAADLPLVEGKGWNWSAGRDGNDLGNVVLAKQGETAPLHRLILDVTDPELSVMHLNGDPLDCRRANLVVRTFSERSAASRKMRFVSGRPCTSRYKGVCWANDRGKWVAQIKVEGRRRQIGRFDDEIAAAEAYDKAARAAWGEHARLNFPDGIDARLAEDAECYKVAA